MNLTTYLCEKPSQARALAAVLGATETVKGAFTGEGFAVTYGFGHLLRLASPNAYIGSGQWKLEDLPILPDEWELSPSPSGKEQLVVIGDWLSKSNNVVLATDPDIEGETLGRQILEWHGFAGNVSRLWASALDPNSLRNALKNLRPLSETDHLYRAGIARHKMDWFLGMNLSRLFSIKLGTEVGIGRVKTALLNAIALREQDIHNFVPQTFFSAIVNIGGELYQWVGDVGRPMPTIPCIGKLVESTIETIAVPPPLPYSLSGLLIDACAAGISLSDAYAAAQSLYEAQAISYPRTSSTALPGHGVGGFAAHHAITTTNSGWTCPDSMGAAARTVYSLIHENCVMQEIGSAHVDIQKTVFEFGGERFERTTRWLADEYRAGWMICVPDVFETHKLGTPRNVRAAVGDAVIAAPQFDKRTTLPPRHHNEASLLGMMVEKELGTESTRVNAITGLARDQVVEPGDGFRLSVHGKTLVGALPDGVRGQDMERIVREVVSAAQNGFCDDAVNDGLVCATKWVLVQAAA